MRLRQIVCSIGLATLMSGSVNAQTASVPPVPPEDSKKLSEILTKIEARDKFRYVDQIEWDDDGYYSITYFTSDKAKVEINIDAITGEPR